MNFTPRDYQIAAKEAAFDYLRNNTGSPCIEIPTGGGKAWVIAMMCKDAFELWEGRVLILAHVKELLLQTVEKLTELAPEIPVGLYSAGLKQRDTDAPILVAGVQSVHDKADKLGHFDLVLIDEAHLIPESGDGMYRSLIADLIEINPDLRVIGLTATPYRLSSGALCKPDGILNEICYSIGVKQLINRGYLSKLVSKAALKEIDTSLLKVVRGEFENSGTEAAFDPVIDAAVAEILQATWDRKSTIIFCQSVAHAQRVVDAIRLRIHNSHALAAEELKKCPLAPADGLEGDTDLLHTCSDWLEEHELPHTALRFYVVMGQRRVGEIYGNTDDDDRDQTIKQFKAGWLQYLVNVNTLTTGFDAPATDCVVLLRATASPGLFYQMVGRGFRKAEGKENCLILDFGKNVERHGPVDYLKAPHKGAKGQTSTPAGKTCPECRSVMALAVSVCLDCGFAFPMPEREPPRPGHQGTADDADVISGEPKTSTHEVVAVTYRIHRKKGASEDAPKTLRVEYQYGAYEFVSEWVCVEHSGFARGKAEVWWSKRCRYGCPTTAAEAVLMADSGLLAVPETITIKRKPDPKAFPEIVGCTLGDVPEQKSLCPRCQAIEERTYLADTTGRFAGYLACGGCHYEYRRADPAEIERFGIEGVAVVNVELEQLPLTFETVYAEDIPF